MISRLHLKQRVEKIQALIILQSCRSSTLSEHEFLELATKNRLPTMIGEAAQVDPVVSCRMRRILPSCSAAPPPMSTKS